MSDPYLDALRAAGGVKAPMEQDRENREAMEEATRLMNRLPGAAAARVAAATAGMSFVDQPMVVTGELDPAFTGKELSHLAVVEKALTDAVGEEIARLLGDVDERLDAANRRLARVLAHRA